MNEIYLAVYQGDDGCWYIEKRRKNDDWWADYVTEFPIREMAVSFAERYAKRNDMEVEVAC